MSNHRKRLGETLVSLRLITAAQLARALETQKNSPAPLGTILVEQGAVTEELLLNALAAQLGVRAWRLDKEPADKAAIARLPRSLCRVHQVLPVAIQGDLMMLAMVNPHDMDAIDAVRNATGMRVEAVLADASRLDAAIDKAHGARKRNEELDDMLDAALKNVGEDSQRETNSISEADSRPVVGLVNSILTDAIRAGASDVHIEPRADRVDVRYRIDGEMRVVRTVPARVQRMLVTRLKIMAELDIVEYRIPQDGRISVNIDGRDVDLRVSVLPNHHGQRIVLRILDKSVAMRRLPELGFDGQDLDLFTGLVAKPYGMFLVTGPTGSGKTTTLYAALGELSNERNNVMTCEDPVEYEMDGVNQSQVNEKVGLTFAKQLRAILRQDPDVLLVGEVRDGETAETAIRAALTGHMVLSTLHCNDAPSAVPRLLDMGIDPFMLSTSLIGAMSQRLVRQLCPACAVRTAPTAAEEAIFRAYGVAVPRQVCRPEGCPACDGSGYKGRAAVHEILPVVPELQALIADRAPMVELRAAGARHGYRPMQNRALNMVATGRTSMEEASRVVFLDAAYAQTAPLRIAA